MAKPEGTHEGVCGSVLRTLTFPLVSPLLSHSESFHEFDSDVFKMWYDISLSISICL